MPQDTILNHINNGEPYVINNGDSIPEAVIKDIIRQATEAVENTQKTATPSDEIAHLSPWMQLVVMIALVITIYKLNEWLNPKLKKFFGFTDTDNAAELPAATAPNPAALIYRGKDLYFQNAELEQVLNRHFIFYSSLSQDNRKKFLDRLNAFISQKTFVIHDRSGFKEMPILISASAIQISFGLDKYLLPFFSHLHIYPEEFLGIHPSLRILEGNVSGHSINLSWKHFLDGYAFPENGQNVGLHEFAHAYYYQYFDAGMPAEQGFVKQFPQFTEYGNKVFEKEKREGKDLYSNYALSHFQEFWAESVELFFERPASLQAKYPTLYNCLCSLLNQQPHLST